MRRPQFTIKTLLWLMAVVAALLGGRAIGIRQEREGRINELIAEQMMARDEVRKTLQQQQKTLQEHQTVLQEQRILLDSQRQVTKATRERLDKMVEQRQASQAPP